MWRTSGVLLANEPNPESIGPFMIHEGAAAMASAIAEWIASLAASCARSWTEPASWISRLSVSRRILLAVDRQVLFGRADDLLRRG